MYARHGGLALLVVLLSASFLSGAPSNIFEQATAVNTKLIDLGYSVHPAAVPLDEVEVWFTVGRDGAWQRYGSDSNPTSTFRFQAPQDGLYGFFFVLSNKMGTSSGPPLPGQEPHQWALIDTAPPLAQIKQVRITHHTAPQYPMLVVSWAAHDDYLKERPVSLSYQISERPGWHRIASQIPNAGRFDWKIPSTVSGHVQIKIEVVDRAGNLGTDISDTVIVPAQSVNSPAAPQKMPTNSTVQANPMDNSGLASPPKTPPPAKQDAQRLYELGIWHKQRGDYGLAIERLIESMNADQGKMASAYELADIYRVEGNYQGALDIYEKIVTRKGGDREALRGSALVMVALQRYPEALEQLQTVLQAAPNDAETWLHGGDVYLWMGRRSEANRYWDEAIRLSPKDSEMAEMAKKRIEKYVLE